MTRMTHQYGQTKRADIPRSSFDLSHGLKTAFNAADLVPILSLECLPGDTISCRASMFGRLATPIKPILDNIFMETFFFFTPTRQLWENWVKFNGEQINPGDSTDFTIPIVQIGANAEGSIFDFYGIPLNTYSPALSVNALPFRAYNKIYNFWFRDENLCTAVAENTGDGPDTNADYEIKKRRKRRDYITSNLPFPQKGPDVIVPIGDTAPIIGFGPLATAVGSSSLPTQLTDKPNETFAFGYSTGTDNFNIKADSSGGSPQIYADLGAATGITINALRESFGIQKLLERDARGGTRYPEILKSHFQITDPSLLVMQRPLFLGGGSSMVNVNPVQQTTPSGIVPEVTPQGNLAAYGTVSGNKHGFTYSATEHGYITGIVNIRADLTYQQGLERYWSRQTRYDFYWPALSHLGEQATLNQEVFLSSDGSTDDGVFGYMPRYDEYRSKQSLITSTMRSSAAASLDVWHLAQDFASLPQLNQAFIEDAPPFDRIEAVPTEPDMLLDVYFKIRAARPLPLYATPGLIDHF